MTKQKKENLILVLMGVLTLKLEYEGTVIEGNSNSVIGSLLDLRYNPKVKIVNM